MHDAIQCILNLNPKPYNKHTWNFNLDRDSRNQIQKLNSEMIYERNPKLNPSHKPRLTYQLRYLSSHQSGISVHIQAHRISITHKTVSRPRQSNFEIRTNLWTTQCKPIKTNIVHDAIQCIFNLNPTTSILEISIETKQVYIGSDSTRSLVSVPRLWNVVPCCAIPKTLNPIS